MFFTKYSNAQLMDYLSLKVYGHTQAKKALINAITRTGLRWYQKFRLRETQNILSTKNVLLIGGSGTGKTFLVETIAELCDMTLIRFDATQIVPSGASSKLNAEAIIDKVRDVAETAAKNSAGQIMAEEAMSTIVVFIDEIDKLCMRYESSGNWNKQVQSTLLQLIDEKTAVKGVTFVFAGAFEDLQKDLKNSKKSMGFSHHHHNQSDSEEQEVDWAEQIVKAGLIPEFVGRISNIVKLDELKAAQYESILDDYILPTVQSNLAHYGIYNFELTKEQRENAVATTVKSGQGVRALKREINKITEELEFNYESYHGSMLLLEEYLDEHYESDNGG